MSFDRDTWSTPQYLFNWLDSIYDLDGDLCASEENAKCDKYFTSADDSLTLRWLNYGYTGFCNPPYSNISPWIDKAITEAKEGFTTVMLIPTPNGEKYYNEIFKHATSITFITGRIAFYNPHLKKHISGNTRGSCVVEFSKKYSNSTPTIRHVLRDDLKKDFK